MCLFYSFSTTVFNFLYKLHRVQREWNILQFPVSNNWTFEHQYLDSESEDVYPQRALTSGTGGGLLLLISLVKTDVDYICSASVQGVKVRSFIIITNSYFLIAYNMLIN